MTTPPARLLALLALLLAILGATVLVTPAAYADRVVHRDAAHDVRRQREGSPHSTAAPRRLDPDIRRVRIAYTRSRLRLRIKVAQLTATRNHAELAQIVTPDFTAGVYVTIIPRLDLVSVSLIRGLGRPVDCPTLGHGLDTDRGVVRLAVPRGCLDRPRWVRVGFALSRTTARVAWSDDGLSDRVGGAPVLTRRLYRG